MTKRAKRVPYSRERRAQALALARIAGAEVASERSRIPVQTIRRWMDAAGVQPGADLPQDRLEALRDLAEATVTADLVAGRIRGVQAMTVAGIARRHIAKPPQPDPDADLREDIDKLEAEVAKRYPGVDLSEILQILIGEDRLSNTDHDPYAGYDDAGNQTGPEPPPLTAEALLAFWGETLDRLIKKHGSITAAHEWQRAEESRRLEEQLARNAAVRDAAIAASTAARLDAETKALLAAAEAYLRSGTDDA